MNTIQDIIRNLNYKMGNQFQFGILPVTIKLWGGSLLSTILSKCVHRNYKYGCILSHSILKWRSTSSNVALNVHLGIFNTTEMEILHIFLGITCIIQYFYEVDILNNYCNTFFLFDEKWVEIKITFGNRKAHTKYRTASKISKD